MKSRNYKLALVIAVGMTTASAAFAQGNDTGMWQKLTSTVKVKVQEWVDYWNGKPAAPANVATLPAAKPAVGTGTTSAAPKAPVAAPAAAPAAQPAAQVQSAPKVSEDNQALRKQKIYETTGQASSLKEIQALRDSVKKASVLKVAQPARVGTSKLPKSKEGVPVADFKKLKVTKIVPNLDIGTEVLVSKEDFTIDQIHFGVGRPTELKKLSTPAPVAQAEFAKALGQPIVKALGAKGLQANIRTVGAPVSKDAIDKIQYTMQPTPEVKVLPYKPMTDEQLKMVAALILFEKGNHCHMIMGLFHQLAQEPKTKMEALYHLGACADSLKMDQVAYDRLAQVVGAEDKEFGAEALELIAKDLPLIYEQDFYRLIKGIKSFKNLVTDKAQDAVAYRTAKGAYRAGDYKTSLTYAGRVNSGTDFYDDARFLTAMDNFALGDKATALKKLQELSASLEARKVQDKNIRALTSVNLARMYFAQKKYDKALEQYMQVPKDHPLWVQALIEQGWTQIALEDYSGAIGNMYSLHSPYFKAVFQPESFVVRSIGYLNICQYGDAYKTLTWMEKDYRDMFEKTSAYMSTKAQPLTMYGSVKTYIKGKSTESVDGVPYQYWREMARRKDFLNLQTALNDKQDEATRYNGVNEKIKTEKASIRTNAESSKKRFDQWKTQLAKISADKGLAKNKEEWERNLKRERDNTIAYRFQLQILELSRQGFLDFQGKAQAKLDSETNGLTNKAGETLVKHAKSMKEEMSRVLDNNEFLRYEVFSGSGENIRYQVSGGNVGNANRVPANIKPQKMMNWNFDGEFWEDEIGSYRSSLQNVCPSAMTRQAKTVEDSE